MRSWHTMEGWHDPPGVSWIEEEKAWNFVLYAREATRVVLLIYSREDQTKPILEYQFDQYRNKSGPVWHCRISHDRAPKAHYYAYRVSGPLHEEDKFNRFDPEKILLDPYAKAVYFPPGFDREVAKHPGPNDGKAPLGVIDAEIHFDWKDDRFIRHDSDLVIYEMHVRGFTKHSSSQVPTAKRGTYAGVIEKIPYLRDLGVTAVELMPIFQYDPQELNYWGYMPLNFFAPHCDYAVNSESQQVREEFREMVQELHRAGIEVILDVVYNHTCEGDDNGPCYSFKGIGNSMYYMEAPDENGEPTFANYSGCGNTLNANTLAVRKLVVDSLKYWRDEMHVDGFRFDLASIFARQNDGTISAGQTPIFSQIVTAEDFLNVRLIAEPWDAAGTYQLGHSFPGWLWMQWNGRYRDTMQQFVAGQPGMIGDLMSRLYGSADLFPDDLNHSCRPWQSVNYITSHDGSTLYDMVTYEGKYNWDNGEENRDGSHEFKWNCGHEGEEGTPPEVMRLRKRQVKNFMTLLMLSNGSAMFRMGDEFMATQKGNNNAYNQDNETSWLDWTRLDRFRDVYRFVKLLIAFRKSHPSLSRSHYWRNDIRWYGPDGPCDISHNSHTLAYSLRGSSVNDQDLYVMINGSREPRSFEICDGAETQWKRILDTALDSPDDIHGVSGYETLNQTSYHLEANSIVVLVRDA
ncbi:MAG: glycogen debranching protein [Rubinisphaera brasiliensis]|uniref:Isoamylase n=1 Tax=Rubinisphaera brasiliensis (strain ATCC 49424 / DSM 5305 / JCM 21570 / IAM 15109 / NBRC 103401 / IFAM 1448) TaxID=756272 RepID=F0SN32_RUBBR|nr:isoamylase [Rubinisphaera brasiliensis]ADY61061.1 isoamylase [Rubinisphaera brasiliensis DSM 5305]MBR9803851.1 glycogen-debranching protein [bacterium]